MKIHILPDKIFDKKLRYACRTLRLEVVSIRRDKVGKYAAHLRDASGRMYLFACKRYIYFRPEMWGIVSFTRLLVEDAVKLGYTLLMLIEEKDESGEARDYIYTFDPRQILGDQRRFDNKFNRQDMVNIDIALALNIELTRRREITESRVNFSGDVRKVDRAQTTVTRWLRR